MQVKLNNSYCCKNWLSNGFMRNQHLMELFSYCKLPFWNSNHLFALSLAMMTLGDLCCRFLDHFSSLEQVRASHWSGNWVIVSLDNSHCELAFKVGLGPRVIFSGDIRARFILFSDSYYGLGPKSYFHVILERKFILISDSYYIVELNLIYNNNLV